MKLLSYYRARFQYPQFKDYVDMGLGIEARYLRCKPYWKRHLELSKGFQSGACSEQNVSGKIAILGAGRLFDVPLDSLAKRFSEISLFDADPIAERSWDRSKRNLPRDCRLFGFLEDVTDTVDEWTARIKNFLETHRRDLKSLAEFLDSLKVGTKVFRNYDAIVSLNLLSQIGIYWRDRVEQSVAVRWLTDTDESGKFPEPLQSALSRSIERLERQHLDALSQSAASLVVLIYDTHFLYYTKDKAPWLAEPSLKISSDIPLSGYDQCANDTWFWHIAPQGIEYPDYGIIHQVCAKAFKRR
jgi:hypothetical protein